MLDFLLESNYYYDLVRFYEMLNMLSLLLRCTWIFNHLSEFSRVSLTQPARTHAFVNVREYSSKHSRGESHYALLCCALLVQYYNNRKPIISEIVLYLFDYA